MKEGSHPVASIRESALIPCANRLTGYNRRRDSLVLGHFLDASPQFLFILKLQKYEKREPF
jgi:hypothetical protein